jgi:hypothetical protein
MIREYEDAAIAVAPAPMTFRREISDIGLAPSIFS